jgi:hypothetical protein
VGKILRDRNRIAEVMIFEAEGRHVVKERFKKLVDAVHQELPAGVDYQCLYDSLRPLAGTHPTAKTLTDYAHRLAGNVSNLKARRVVRPWSYQIEWEWVPLSVVRVRRTKNPAGRIGATLTFKILAGTPAALLTERFWSMKQCAFMSRQLGFSRPPSPRAVVMPRRPYMSPEQFVTLRMYGLIDPKRSGAEVGPVVSRFRFPPSCVAFNAEQHKYRTRGPGYACPRAFPLTVLCHQCPVGFEECRAGCHAKTYETKACAGCKKERAPFDPETQSPVCVNCTTKAVYTKES